MVERLVYTEVAVGSSPSPPTNLTRKRVPRLSGRRALDSVDRQFTMKFTVLEVPPPGVVFFTVTALVPGRSTKAAGTTAVKRLGETSGLCFSRSQGHRSRPVKAVSNEIALGAKNTIAQWFFTGHQGEPLSTVRTLDRSSVQTGKLSSTGSGSQSLSLANSPRSSTRRASTSQFEAFL